MKTSSPCKIVAPSAVCVITGSQRGETACSEVISGAKGSGRAVGIYIQGYTETQCTRRLRKIIKKLLDLYHWTYVFAID